METSVLVGQPTVLEPADGVEPPSVLALRQAVTPVTELPGLGEQAALDPPTVAQLRQAIRSTEQTRRRGELTTITAALPLLIADARAAVDAYQGADQRAAYAVLAAERAAPEWMKYHATSRRLVAELRAREQRRRSPVRELAMRLHVQE